MCECMETGAPTAEDQEWYDAYLAGLHSDRQADEEWRDYLRAREDEADQWRIPFPD